MEQPWLILPLCKLLPMLLQMPALHYYMDKLKNINLAKEKNKESIYCNSTINNRSNSHDYSSKNNVNDNNSLQTSLEKNHSNSSDIFLLNVNFENLTVGFYVFYVLNTHVKFHSNWMLFII